ncbi:regulator of CtrA degradation [Rhodobium orientis]|uniref:Regulator of CtrA degradation n=1 Tax=Rhodobium orientis TaxID=34017 RepID=A0A327JWK4_9HYPH|nr:DUF1465 family protein [Rhodobium orientis]MBB4302981.1 regulator of CtrA degradation [Rhodobium orientis]MBK5949542.1 regulator of CtrA degradation [Rhodobium orientis]RAI29332.1 regulator of CtrA degradation [Rhodobium orientis]
MKDKNSTNDPGYAEPVPFAERLANSENFLSLFREGMALVEESAAYLDSEGREESKSLDRAASLTYATESMRLTTRLMQLASWLLLQRAVNEGEMTHEQAGEEKSKVRLDSLSSPCTGPGWEMLPVRLKDLIARSVRLQERIRILDAAIYKKTPTEPEAATSNPVAAQLSQLANAFRQGSD